MDIIKFIFGGLFSNKIILEGRKRAGWLATLIFALSMILAVVPTFTSLNALKGSDILGTAINGADNAMCEFVEQLNVHGIDLVIEPSTIDNKTEYVLKNKHQEVWNTTFGGAEQPYEYKAYDGAVENVRFKVFYLDKNRQEVLDFRNDLLAKKYIADSEDVTKMDPIVSFMILGRESIHIVIYAKGITDGSQTQGQMTGVYSKSLINTNIKSFRNSDNSTQDLILERWTTFLDKAYAPINSNAILMQIGIYALVNLLVVFMVSLMVFVTTRGKKNPFRDYTYIQSLKIAAFAALCPALLTIIVGSFLPAYASMVFMLTLGMRIMWLTSKHLKPMPVSR